jgi:hypothetical protein
MSAQVRRSGDAPWKPRAPKGAAADEELRRADLSDVARPIEEDRAGEEQPRDLDDEVEDLDPDELEDLDLEEKA